MGNGWVDFMRNQHDDTRFGADTPSVAGSNNDSGTGTDMGRIGSAPGSDNNDSGTGTDFGRIADAPGDRNNGTGPAISGPPDNMLGVPDPPGRCCGVSEAIGGHPGQVPRGV